MCCTLWDYNLMYTTTRNSCLLKLIVDSVESPRAFLIKYEWKSYVVEGMGCGLILCVSLSQPEKMIFHYQNNLIFFFGLCDLTSFYYCNKLGYQNNMSDIYPRNLKGQKYIKVLDWLKKISRINFETITQPLRK